MKKLLSLLMVMALMLSLFTGCVQEETYTSPPKDKTDAIDDFDYTLDDDTVKDFDALLQEAEALAKGDDLAEAEEAMDRLTDAYMDLVDQNQIAYVKYCVDQSQEAAKEQYLYSEEVINQAEADINAMNQRIYLSESPIRDALFADWSQEEIDMMLLYNEEIKELNTRNSQITTEYRDLEEDEAWEENMVRLYNELVRNNNRIAQIYGYENYYVFAHKMIYQRDYDSAQLQTVRDLVAQYLPECFDYSYEAFAQKYQALSKSDNRRISELVNSDYDELSVNYLSDYLASLPETAKAGMAEMFDGTHSVFTDNKNAYEGAFTTFIDEAPFCFFGPGYFDCETVVHELGHYYGSKYVDSFSQPIDLAETQSQGNEWLFVQFLEGYLSADAYACFVDYRLMSAVGDIIVFVMVDAFEELVYTHKNAGDLTLSQYDALMTQVAKNYGGISYVSENIADVQMYWKYVVLESPVYYISYGVSALAAIDLFTIAEADPQEARRVYCKLVEEPLTEEGFLANITYAGMVGPFDESLYETLLYRYKK